VLEQRSLLLCVPRNLFKRGVRRLVRCLRARFFQLLNLAGRLPPDEEDGSLL